MSATMFVRAIERSALSTYFQSRNCEKRFAGLRNAAIYVKVRFQCCSYRTDNFSVTQSHAFRLGTKATEWVISMATVAGQTAKPAKATKTRRKPRNQNAYALLLLAPGLATVLVLAVWPMILVARNSVAESDVFGAVTGGFTLEPYLSLADPVYFKTMGYSLGVAAINTALCLVIGYIVANYIVAQSPQRQPLLLLLLIVPFWTDFLVRTFAWITLLGNGGPILSFAHLLGIPLGTLVPSQTAVMLALVYAFLPTAVFPIYASMRGIDPALKEAATDLGCGWWQTHARIVVPLSTPGIIGAALLTFVPTLGVFVIPVLLGGGKQLLVGNLIVTLYTEFRNQPMGAALSMILLILMILSIAIGALVLKGTKRRGV